MDKVKIDMIQDGQLVTGNMQQAPMVVTSSASSPAEMLQMAVASGLDVDKLSKILELQERWEATQATKAYNLAMSKFKANPPVINKDRQVKYSTSKGSVGYSHASLYNVVDKITAELSKYGLSASWRTAQNDKSVSVTCRICHSMGHYEETTISAPADDSGAKNAIQAIGSTISYLQRYSLLSLTGLATQDQDTDGVVAEDKIDENKVAIIKGLLTELAVDEKKFLEFIGADKVESIKSADFAKAKLSLEARRKAKK